MEISISPLSSVHGLLTDWRPDAVISILSPKVNVVPFDHLTHLVAYCHDIEAPRRGCRPPSFEIIDGIIAVARDVHKSRGRLLIHCNAGLSRAPAAALVAAMAVSDKRDAEARIEQLAALAPWAQPNRLLVAIGAARLGHDGDAVVSAVGRFFTVRNRAWFGAIGDLAEVVMWPLWPAAGAEPGRGA